MASSGKAKVLFIVGLAWRGRARRTDQLRAGLVVWGTWLVTFGVIYSVMNNILHTAYTASLAPPLAALSGTGMVLFWRWYRSGSPAGWLLPAAVASELAWACCLWSGYRSFLPWALPITIAAGTAAIVVMVAAQLSQRVRGAVAGAGLAAGVAAMLAGPGGAGGGIFGSTTLTSSQHQLYRYVSAHRDGAGYLLAVRMRRGPRLARAASRQPGRSAAGNMTFPIWHL